MDNQPPPTIHYARIGRPLEGETPPVIDYAPGDGGKSRPSLAWLIPLGVAVVLIGIIYLSFRAVPPPARPATPAPVAPPTPVSAQP